ncbi:MAG TPA: shikimate kinase [Clostridiales bacterium]|jgi:shikimate kinase|nr:shikimate kinase [Clostridiales bacterium]
MKNIVLIGMMGTFKTSAGKIVAKELKRDFIDTDKVLANRFGMSINQYFKKFGEQSFRGQEHLLCQELTQNSNLIISTGGGIVKNPKNIELLRQNGIIICLMASAEQIYSRIKNFKTRPLLNCPNPLERIRQILAEREYLYISLADTVINNNHMSASQTALKIIEYIQENSYKL